MGVKKYQVFVSSTFRDLIEERQDAIRSILDLQQIPAGMELFPAADVDQLNYIKRIIDECDYYLLIVGGRYGTMDVNGVSYTELEYDYAVESGKVVLAFVHESPAEIPLGKSDIDPTVAKALDAFREKVMTGRLVRGWSNRQQLESLVVKALSQAFNQMPRVGWIRGDSAATDTLLEQSNNALQENADLRAQIAKFSSAPAVTYSNIAELDDFFSVRCKVSRYGGDRETSVNLTWRQIFLALAAELEKPKTTYAITSAIRIAAKEIAAVEGVASVEQTDVRKIKIQMLALGLIDTQVLGLSTGGQEEFLMLTQKGKALFIDGFIVRKVQG